MWILFLNRYRILISDLRHHKKKVILAAIAFALLPAWVFIQSYHVFLSWNTSAPSHPFLYDFILKTFWGLFVFFILSSISLTVHFNYLSKEIELLLPLPFSVRTLFGYQFLNTVLANFPLFLGLGLSCLLALGIALKVSFIYYPFILLLSACFMFITTALATILSLFLVRLLSAKILRTVTSLIVSIFFIAVWTSLQLAGGGRFQPDMHNNNAVALQSLNAQIHYTGFMINPPLWFTNGVYGFINGDMKPVWISTFFSVTGALLLLMITLILMEHSFQGGFSAHHLDVSLRPRLQKNNALTKRRPFFSFSISSVLVRQNMLLVIRDSRHLLQLILFCSMLIVIPFLRAQDSEMYLSPWDFASPFALMMYFLAFLTSMNTARSIPVERFSYGYVRIAPIPVHYYLLAKIGTSCFFSFLAITLSLGIFYVKFSIPFESLVSLSKMSFIMILGSSGIGIFTGAFFAKFDWDHPKQMLRTGGSVTLAVLCFIYWLIVFGFLIFWEERNVNMGFFITFSISVGLIIMGTALAKYKLESKEWLY
jgi:hypothetical protein